MAFVLSSCHIPCNATGRRTAAPRPVSIQVVSQVPTGPHPAYAFLTRVELAGIPWLFEGQAATSRVSHQQPHRLCRWALC